MLMGGWIWRSSYEIGGFVCEVELWVDGKVFSYCIGFIEI